MAPVAQADYGTTPAPNGQCGGCHGPVNALDGTGRINAANTGAMISRAIALGFMAVAGPTDATSLQNIANEIGANNGPFTQSRSVNYGSTNNSITVNKVVVPSGILDRIVQTSAVAGTNLPVIGSDTFTYNHVAGNCNSQVITVVGREGAAGVSTTARTITINVNTPTLLASNATYSIPYSTGAQTINVSAQYSSIPAGVPASGTINFVSGLSPAVGARAATGATTFTYAADPNTYAQTVTFQYSIDGPSGCGVSSTATATLDIGLPPPPTVLDVGSAGAPNIVSSVTPTPFNLTALGRISGVTASNPAGTYPVVTTAVTPPAAGTTSVVGNTITFTPSGTFTGAASFQYTKAGPGGTSLPATVYLNVTAAPITSAASATTAFNTPITVNLATACGGSSCISSSTPVLSVTPSSPSNGAAVATGPTSIQFTPTAGFFGAASFAYTATNAGGTSSPPSTVSITVNPPPPTVSAGTATAAFNPGSPVISTSIDLAPFIGPPGATVLSVAPTVGTNGTVVATGPTTVSFTPTAGFIGAATFTFTATNVAGTSASAATVNVTVTPPPPPVATAQTFLVSASAPTTFDLAPGVSGVFTPQLQVVTQPATGTVAFNGTIATYTPPASGASGTLTFTYRAVGLGGPSAPATVTLRSVQTPVASNINVSTPMNTAARIDLTDAFAGFVQTYRISRLPANGTASIAGQIVTYTPNAGFIGTDTFEFTGTGPGGTSPPGVATVNVTPPIATVIGLDVSTPFQTPVTIDLTRAISGFATGFNLTTAPSRGTVVITGTTAVYTPATGFSGVDTFQVAAVNGTGTSAPGPINVTVGSLAPTGRPATMRVGINGSGTLDLAPFITGSGVTGITISTLPNHGLAEVDGTKVTYTPRTGYFGSDAFEYVAFGNAGRSPPVKILVVIEGRPDPSQDKNVRAILDNQAMAARRFSRAQITNYQRRMETLHVPGPVTPSAPDEDPESAPADAKKPAAAAPKAPAAANGIVAAASPKAPVAGLSSLANGFVPPPSALPGSPARATPGAFESTFANSLASLASGRSLNLNGSTDAAKLPGPMSGVNFWVGGTASFGTRSLGDDEGPYRFSTDGLSIGADRRLDDRLALGLGMGYARDRSDLGGDGTKNKSRGGSLAVYGSYHPSPSTYLDGLLGFGNLKFESDRYVDAFGETLSANRKGDQFFASIAGGYEYRVRNFLVAPYGRLDVTVDRLKSATEGGSSPAALTFEEQTQRTTSAAAGLRLESTHETDYGRVVPRARFEYRHDFEGGRTANITYADFFGGLTYSVSPAGTSRNAFLLGVGSDFLLASGWKIGVDYQGERSQGPGTVQSVRFLVSKDLDGKGLPAWSGWTMPLKIPVNVDFGMVWDDNIARGRLDEEIRSDRVYTLNVNRAYEFPINKNARAIATALFTVDKPHTYTGLGHFAAGAQGEVQYRSSGDFDAVTYAIYARGLYDQFESNLRTGPRYTFGANLRKSLTDRIDLFADLSHNRRYGKSAVFQTVENAGRVNFDYSLGKDGTLYLSGEYRRGDIFSSGFASLTNIAIADVATRDDAFDGGEFFAYRFDGRTVLGTFGYNRPLGARDAIDFSIRRVQSTPSNRPDFDEGGRLRYIVNQYSLLYLLRF